MTLVSAFSIFFGAMGTALIRKLYYGWKDARTEIPVYRNWRGEWVPDLWLIRAKRAFIFGILLFLAVVLTLMVHCPWCEKPLNS